MLLVVENDYIQTGEQNLKNIDELLIKLTDTINADELNKI